MANTLAWHRHQGGRYWHSGIRNLSPVQEHSGTGLVPLIPIPDWLRHRHFLSDTLHAGQSGIAAFKHNIQKVKGIQSLHLQTANTRLLLAL
jgi:hypothetical protein